MMKVLRLAVVNLAQKFILIVQKEVGNSPGYILVHGPGSRATILYVTGAAPGTVPASGALLSGNLMVTVPGIVSAVPGSPVAGLAIDRCITKITKSL